MLRSIIEIHDSDGSFLKLEDEGSSELPEPCAITFPTIKEEIKWDPDELKQLACSYADLGDAWSQRARPELKYSSSDDDSDVDLDVIDLTREESVRDIKGAVEDKSDAKICCPTTAAITEASLRHSNKKEKSYAFAAENTSTTKNTVQEKRNHRSIEHKSRKEFKKHLHRKHSRSAHKDRSVRKTTTVPQKIADPEKEVCSCEYETKTCAVHEDRKRHFCSLCGAMFLWKEYLDLHMASHAREMPYSCSVCSAKFRLRESLGKHMRFHPHSKEEIKSATPVTLHPLSAPFGCAICNLHFLWQEQLSRHLVVHPDKKLVFCVICGSQFSYEDELFAHVADHTRKRYSSTVCNALLVHPQDRSDRHSPGHSEKDKFPCSSCARSFASSELLECHSRLCGSQRPQLPCNSTPEVRPIIRTVVSDREGLANAREGGASVSRGEGLSKCGVARNDLRVHTARSVTVYKDFHAPSSQRNQDLDESVTQTRLCSPVSGSDVANRHTKVHMLEDKLCCALCDAKFNVKPSLERHMFICHPRKPYL